MHTRLSMTVTTSPPAGACPLIGASANNSPGTGYSAAPFQGRDVQLAARALVGSVACGGFDRGRMLRLFAEWTGGEASSYAEQHCHGGSSATE